MTPRPPYNVYAVISTLKIPLTGFQLASETNKIKAKKASEPLFHTLIFPPNTFLWYCKGSNDPTGHPTMSMLQGVGHINPKHILD